MNRRTVFLVSLVIALGLGTALFLMFSAPSRPETTSRRDGFTRGRERFSPLPAREQLGHVGPEKPADVEKRPRFIEFFRTSIQISPLLADQLKPLLSFVERSSLSPKSKTAEASPKIVVKEQELTPDQVFHALFPDIYLNTLSAIQDVLVRYQAIATAKKFGFNKEDDVMQFNDTLFGFLMSRGAISNDDYNGYLSGRALLFDRPYSEKYLEAQEILADERLGIRETGLPTAEEAEKQVQELLRSQGLPRTFELLPEPVSASCHDVKSFAITIPGTKTKTADIILQILGLFSSMAQASECYRSGAGGGSKGSNFTTPCCSCKIGRMPVGCLDICKKSAIWDSDTKICGCNK